MRIFLLAIVLFISIHFIHKDLVEGTIPLQPTPEPAPASICEDQIDYITVTTIMGDTVESLFSLYHDSSTSFLERLTDFYALNPHLQKQKIIGGEKIKLPISNLNGHDCVN